jgi:inosine/xanthosine triphosphate pyrophosphatase family protein
MSWASPDHFGLSDKAISAEQLLKIVNTLSSRKAHFELAAAYVDEHGEAHSFQYSVPIEIADKVCGTNKLRWERLMMIEGDDRTFAEFSSDDRAKLWTKNYEEIARLIQHAA